MLNSRGVSCIARSSSLTVASGLDGSTAPRPLKFLLFLFNRDAGYDSSRLHRLTVLVTEAGLTVKAAAHISLNRGWTTLEVKSVSGVSLEINKRALQELTSTASKLQSTTERKTFTVMFVCVLFDASTVGTGGMFASVVQPSTRRIFNKTIKSPDELMSTDIRISAIKEKQQVGNKNVSRIMNVRCFIWYLTLSGEAEQTPKSKTTCRCSTVESRSIFRWVCGVCLGSDDVT